MNEKIFIEMYETLKGIQPIIIFTAFCAYIGLKLVAAIILIIGLIGHYYQEKQYRGIK